MYAEELNIITMVARWWSLKSRWWHGGGVSFKFFTMVEFNFFYGGGGGGNTHHRADLYYLTDSINKDIKT